MRSLSASLMTVTIVVFVSTTNSFRQVPFHLKCHQKISNLNVYSPSLMLHQNKDTYNSQLFGTSLSSSDIVLSSLNHDNNVPLTEKCKSFLFKAAKVLLPIGLNILAIFILGVPISFAATGKGKSRAAAMAVDKITKPPPLWKKILEGANVTGNFKKWKPGDTRSEFSAIVNAATSVIILLGFVVVGTLHYFYTEKMEETNLKKEIIRLKEYKENMYFDAVEEILNKIADPKIKPATKTNLQKQLKDLDPQGSIMKFVKEGGPRPDLSGIMGKKSTKKSGSSGSSSGVSGIKKKAPTPPPIVSKPSSSSSSSNNSKEDEEDEEEEEEQVNKPALSSSKGSSGNNGSKNGNSANSSGSSGGKSSGGNSGGSGPVAKKPEVYIEVLNELDESLTNRLPTSLRTKLIAYLRTRLESVSDSTKRAGAAAKIAEKLGDTNYWIDYAARL